MPRYIKNKIVTGHKVNNNTRQCCIMKQANSFWTLEKNVVIVGKMQLLQRVAAVIRAFHREDQPPIITENRVIPYGFDGRGAGISLGGRLHGILSFRGGGTGCSTCPAACQKQPCTRQKFCELPSVQNFSPITCVWKRSSSEYRHHQRQHLRQHGSRA